MDRTVSSMEGIDSAAVDKAVTTLEAQLLKYKRNGYGIDLPMDPTDASRTDPIFAAATMKLLAKYGDALVISRFRERPQIAWRVSAFGVVQKENREKLDSVGFYTIESMEDFTGVDPNGIGLVDPAAIEAARKKRVEEWRAKGWKGVMLPNGDFYIPPDDNSTGGGAA